MHPDRVTSNRITDFGGGVFEESLQGLKDCGVGTAGSRRKREKPFCGNIPCDRPPSCEARSSLLRLFRIRLRVPIGGGKKENLFHQLPKIGLAVEGLYLGNLRTSAGKVAITEVSQRPRQRLSRQDSREGRPDPPSESAVPPLLRAKAHY